MIAKPFAQREERYFYALVGAGLLVLLVALLAFHDMESHGHIISGMNNQIVWGTPHVFAIFLIVAASGVLNIASMGSVFGKAIYKARAPLSGLLSIAMLAGGLMVLLLDLGRPDRMIVAITHYNFKSIFAWNIILYSGLFAIVAVYLWTMMERRMNRYSKPAGFTAFLWRIILTTGTGSIFAFLVARQGFGTAVLAPLFVVMSFGWGLAVFYIVQAAMFRWNDLELHGHVQKRMNNLLGIFVAGTFYFVVVFHLTNLYFERQTEFERFILVEGGAPTLALWLGYVLIGTVLPLLLLYHPTLGRPRDTLFASVFVLIGAFAFLYSLIIGGQSFPLEIFPGFEVTSTFADGQVTQYTPSLPEILLGLGGLAAAFLITTIGVRVLHFLPDVSEHDDRHPTPAAAK